MSEIKILIGPDVVCPRCGAKEVEDNTLPIAQWKWNIRAYKVTDAEGRNYSQCLRCKEAGAPNEGWFCDR